MRWGGVLAGLFVRAEKKPARCVAPPLPLFLPHFALATLTILCGFLADDPVVPRPPFSRRPMAERGVSLTTLETNGFKVQVVKLDSPDEAFELVRGREGNKKQRGGGEGWGGGWGRGGRSERRTGGDCEGDQSASGRSHRSASVCRCWYTHIHVYPQLNCASSLSLSFSPSLKDQSRGYALLDRSTWRRLHDPCDRAASGSSGVSC